MAIKKIKVVIWTDTIKAELTGGAADNGQDALNQILIGTGSREAREKALAALQETHNRVCAWEDERAKGAVKNG